jgi:YD repeat-containing protein
MGEWSPTNPAGMVQTTASVYDGKVSAGMPDTPGVGDGNLTRSIQYPSGRPVGPSEPADRRLSDFFYDWRDRQVAGKAGATNNPLTEDTVTHRPISYVELDNLSQALASERYDGDQVTVSDGNGDGVPDKPAANRLRARSTTSYDDRGRVYRTQTFSVDPVTGAVSTNSLISNSWYNRRGLTTKTAPPGGLATKYQYDGAGRTLKVFQTDGRNDSVGDPWANAASVSDDTVLMQSETQYDASGNVLVSVSRERFHNETAYGELLGPTGAAPKARVAYRGNHYDKADRLITGVNVGTNGGTAWTQPPLSMVMRSDTMLVTDYAYNAAGWVEATTDPRGLVRKQFYDHAGRVTKTVEAYTDGVPSNSDDKTTEYSYDSGDRTQTLKALLAGGGF